MPVAQAVSLTAMLAEQQIHGLAYVDDAMLYEQPTGHVIRTRNWAQALPEDQRPETLIGLCRDLVDALPQVTRVYACITYGSKSIPVVTLTALTCAEATHTELEVGGVYYGEVKRENGRVLSARLYDMAALYQLSGLVGTMRDSRTAEQVFHQLIWMNERRED